MELRSTAELTVLVIAKQPRAGLSKTRLAPRVGLDGAAVSAAAALEDTLLAVEAAPAGARVLVWEGECVERPGWTVLPQVAGTLDARLAAALGSIDGPVLLVGMDTPQLTPELLTFTGESALGLAEDGGWWAIAFAAPTPNLTASCLIGVPMSTATTGHDTLDRMRGAGLQVTTLPVLRDIDTPTDADEVAAAHPHTRFAAVWASLQPVAA